jgi:DNA-binding transcriptional LysR family regulator
MDKFAALFAKGGLSLDRLRTLCLLGDSPSLTHAAGGDPTRVSLFSRQLRELESFFGARLAQRRGKTIALTPAGADLARMVRRQFTELLDFTSACAGRPVEVALGAGQSAMEWMLLPHLPMLRKSLRRARLKLVRESSESLAARLRDMRIDVAIIREESLTEALRAEPFLTLDYYLCVPRALAGPARSLRHWLPRVPMMLPGAGWTRTQIDAAAQRAGITLRAEIEGASATLAMRVLREGHLAAILPESARRELAGADVVAFRPAFVRELHRRLVVAWNPRMIEARPQLMDVVRAILTLR